MAHFMHHTRIEIYISYPEIQSTHYFFIWISFEVEVPCQVQKQLLGVFYSLCFEYITRTNTWYVTLVTCHVYES